MVVAEIEAPVKEKLFSEADPRSKPYQPFGSSVKTFYAKEDEVIIVGPAGTGKSRGALEKLHLVACKYPKMRGLIIRKTRESLTQSAMVTFETFVIPENGSVRWRTSEQEYRYANGSKIVIGGMDKSSKVLSTDYDLIYVMEATELTVDDWEVLTTRARYGIVPYNQLIGCCNPGPPKHWLKQRIDAGSMKHISSIHQDNPVLYDHLRKEWTEKGEAYLRKLNKLTGVRKRRLLKGLWAAAEGMIFDMWDPEVHLINKRGIPPSWRRIWMVDFGFTNPFVWQAWAIDDDNDIAYRYAEIYVTQTLVEDAAKMISDWQRDFNEPRPEAIICDHDAEDRATLERYLGYETIAADKRVKVGLDTAMTRFTVKESKKPGYVFFRDACISIDEELKESGKPTCTEQEIEGYVWDPKSKVKEKPIKIDDHGLDLVRYLGMYLNDADSWSIGMKG